MTHTRAAEPLTPLQRYERLSSIPVFLLGVMFLVGFTEAITGGDRTVAQTFMVVAWFGFVVDLAIRWTLDGDPRTFARRNWLVLVSLLIPVFRMVIVLYAFLRVATGRRRLQTRVQLYAVYLTALVVLFGATLVLACERGQPGANIENYGEAVWWAVVTVTTVGYGDYTPVTGPGRVIASIMLVNGVALISVVTATIASRFVSDPQEGEEAVTLDDVDHRLQRLEELLAQLAAARPLAAEDGPADRADRP